MCDLADSQQPDISRLWVTAGLQLTLVQLNDVLTSDDAKAS